MFLPDFSIRRPVLVVMAAVALVVFGLISLGRLPVREMPAMDFPVVMVGIDYPGASPEVVDLDVVDPLEDELNTIQGIRRLESVSVDGAARIDIEFELEKDIDVAAQEVQERLGRVRPTLPRGIEEPVVTKLDLDAQPVVWLALTGRGRSIVEITEYWDKQLRPRFERVPGVGQFLLAGAKEYAVRVWLDPARLAARAVTASDVVRALEQQNADLPAGSLEGIARELSVKFEGRVESIEQLGEIVVAAREGGVVQLRDVARITPGARDERATARFSRPPDSLGVEAVGIGVLKQTHGNTVEVAGHIKALVAEVTPGLPAGMELSVALDTSIFVEQSISEVKEALLLGALLTVVVVLLFLGGGRPTLIISLALPTSILASFTALYALGFSINTFTMLALVLVVGVVIDDAILVLENVHRHHQLGAPAPEAARAGTSQVAFAAIVTTMTLVVIFAPLAFVHGMVGRMLAEFALTIAVSVTVSTLVALTLVPMLCSRYLAGRAAGGAAPRSERWAGALGQRYANLLAAALRRRWAVVLLAVGILAGTVFVVPQLGTEMSPPVDEGAFVTFLIAPEGSSPAYTDEQLQELEAILAATPEVESFLAITAPSFGGIVPKANEAAGLVRLKPLEERRAAGLRSQAEVMAALRTRLAALPGSVTTVFARPGLLSGSSGAPIQLAIFAPDLETLRGAADTLERELAAVPGIVDITVSLTLNKPKLRARPLREAAGQLGLELSALADTMQTLLAGSEVTTLLRGGQTYDVVVQLEPDARRTPSQLDALQVRARSGELVPLTAAVVLEETVDVNEVRRYDRARTAYLEAHLDGVPLGDALAAVDEVAARVLPPSVTVRPVGPGMGMEESFASLLFTFALGVLVTYMLLASQFNHLVHPLTIMLALPLGLFGAVTALWLFGLTLNLFSFIGIMMLTGLVVKNSVLLIEYANQMRRDEGMERDEAILAAARVRLRPILMTAASTVLAVMPAVLGFGAGSEARRPLVVAVFGGMTMSTVLTLLVVPVFYSLLDGLGGRLVRRSRRPS